MSRRNCTVGALALTLTAATVMAGDLPSVGSWDWTEVNGDAPWVRRAGLQVVELGGSMYLMGGRTSRPPSFPPIPGDSDIWGDVWTSDDQGVTWQEILSTGSPGHWSPRAYFRAAVMGDTMFVMGGQDFAVIADPTCLPPYDGCLPFIPISNFFNDVWSSTDGINWTQLTADAGWSGRAGLSSVVFNDEIYIVGGSFLDDPVFGGPPVRVYFNDVWKSADGIDWVLLNDDPPFEPRAGAVLAVKDGFIYLIGGEDGFTCEPLPCEPPYFNDVWRTQDGVDWELVTPAADWSPRPGHQAVVVGDEFILFGGFGQSTDPNAPFQASNPMDVWVSTDGAQWSQVSDAPWNATMPDEIKFDFAALTTAIDGSGDPAIYTFGGDRETFDFTDPFNYLEIDNDVWRFTLDTCPADIDDDGTAGILDLLALLSAIGPCDDCAEDLNGNDYVGLFDLIWLLFAWGPCE